MAAVAPFRRKAFGGLVSFNMTPMIDCTFQLIIFFILTSRMASESLVSMELPRPHESQAIPSEQIENPDKVIVNVLSAEEGAGGDPALSGRAQRYQVGNMKVAVENLEALRRTLVRLRRSSGSEHFCIEVRADHRVNFSEVRPVMLVAAQAEIVNINITALTRPGE